jgi:drug/metabolite transporter (DMT)-like permease
VTDRVVRWWAPLGLLGAALSLGTGHVCARYAFGHGVGIMTAATFRALCASAILLALLRWRRMPLRVSSQAFRGILLLGLGVVAQTLLIQVAVKRLPVTLAILVFYTYPFLTAIATAALGEHRLTRARVASLVVAFCGLALVLGVNPDRVDLPGLAAAAGASLAFTGILVLTPRLAPGVAAPLRTFLMMSTAATVFGGSALAAGVLSLPTDGAAWQGLAGLAIFYAAGVVMLFLLLPSVGAASAAVMLNLEPVAVAGIAGLALGEHLGAWQWVGALVVVGAIVHDRLRAAGP